MVRVILILVAVCSFAIPSVGFAQANYAESGWRASTAEEESLRRVFENAQDDWDSDRDGEAQLYQCVMRWASWSNIVRSEQTDVIPAISGELMHPYADGHLSHHLTTLARAENGSAEAVGRKLALAAQEYAQRPDESLETIMRSLGKCHVPPLSWSIRDDLRLTGPQLLQMLGDPTSFSGWPAFVRSQDSRAQFDQLIRNQDFAAAANLGAQLHGREDKTTVMWNEVLRASLLAVEDGRGLALSEPLLGTLSEVWWPRHRRGWASELLRMKRGLPAEQASRPPLHDPGQEPAWAKSERERYSRGETSYVPCNRWNRQGC